MDSKLSQLFSACSDGNINRTRELLDEGVIDIEAKDDGEYTPLIFACSNGRVAIATSHRSKGWF